MIFTEILALVYVEIAKLPEKRRQTFRMAYLEGMDNDKIARTLDVSIGTVKTQKARAILALRVKFAGHVLLCLLYLYRLPGIIYYLTISFQRHS